jgi:YD repeat-containing protein
MTLWAAFRRRKGLLDPDSGDYPKSGYWELRGRNVKQSGASGDYLSQYDPAGRRTRITHPDGFYVTQDYLVTGEMTAIRENGSFVLAAFGYDRLGRRERLTLGNGAVTTYGYDAAGRLETLGHDLGGSDATNDNLVTFCALASPDTEGSDRSARNENDASGPLLRVKKAFETPIPRHYAKYGY